jgi:hypothetical protein
MKKNGLSGVLEINLNGGEPKAHLLPALPYVWRKPPPMSRINTCERVLSVIPGLAHSSSQPPKRVKPPGFHGFKEMPMPVARTRMKRRVSDTEDGQRKK